MNERRGIDIPGIAGSVIAIVAAGLAWYHAGAFSAMGAVFPRTVAAVMLIAAAAYIAVAILRPAARQPAGAASTWRRIALVVVLALWSAFLEQVGFLTTSLACFAAILVIANYDRWTPRTAALYSLAGAAIVGGLYATFRFALQVPLPAGHFL
ncbi:MAG: tripartite tricarboxylate transporter TctB family protein [Burkholderiales bacterium]|nr:tripartite tricarboxylate transporter TctB family protein [Burkholderiales bacterium]